MPLTVGDLAQKLNVRIPELIKTLMGLGIFANVNQLLNEEIIHRAGKAFDIDIEKIEDEVIQVQIDKLIGTKELNIAQNQNTKVMPQKEEITYEDFSKLDIRIGTILEAEKVEKSKKLLKLKIDTGLDQRTVISGIAEYFKAEEIIGRQVSILINLQPRKIMSTESQGMILMAENADGSLEFIQPSADVDLGSTVS